MAKKQSACKNAFSITLILGLMGTVSCGKKNASAPPHVAPQSPTAEQVIVAPKEDEELDPGIYKAQLRPANPGLNPQAFGEIEIIINDKDFIVEAHVNGIHEGIQHFQSIHVGQECPDENSDENFDGVVDAHEARSKAGAVLIPLDSHLNTQVEGIEFGPIANEEGYYFYRRSASFPLLMNDLYRYDDDPEDNMAKLIFGAKFYAAKRVVMVFGVSPAISLPATVRGEGEHSPHRSLPVLCGRLERMQIE